MLEDMDKKDNPESVSLNKLESDPPPPNRGVELLLRNRRRTEKPKTFQIKFGNMISFLRREIVFHFNFYLDIRKK